MDTLLSRDWHHLPHDEIARLLESDSDKGLDTFEVARTGVPGFIMGNTAEKILNQIDCSVLAIKPAVFKTPVKL